MPKDGKNQTVPDQDLFQIPDLMELWKSIYFSAEENWSKSARELVASDPFIQMLHEVKDQYLSSHKVFTACMDKYFETSPVPSKKDIARVAELVIALEDKVDALDLQFANNLDSIARSFLKMVDIQQSLHKTIQELRDEIRELHRLSDQPEQAREAGDEARPAPRGSRNKKVKSSETEI